MNACSKWLRIGTTVALLLVTSESTIAAPAPVASAAAAIRAPVDLDGNGTSDLVWWDFLGGAVAMWLLGPGGVIASGAFAVDTSYRFVGAGDVDRDGRDDLVWQRHANAFDSVVVVWQMDGPQVRSTAAFWPPNPAWVAQSVADVDGDGAADIVLTAPDATRATTPVAVWFLAGMRSADGAWVEFVGPRIGGGSMMPAAPAQVAGIGDFDGSGRRSVVLTDPTSWPPGWLRFDPDRSGVAGFTAFDWRVGRYGYTGLDGAFGDFDGDGVTDAYWHWTGTLQPPTSDVSVIDLYSGGVPVASRAVQWPSAQLPILGAADYDGSGTADLAWWYCDQLAIWLAQPAGGFAALDLGPYPTDRNWIIVPRPAVTPSVNTPEPFGCPPG